MFILRQMLIWIIIVDETVFFCLRTLLTAFYKMLKLSSVILVNNFFKSL